MIRRDLLLALGLLAAATAAFAGRNGDDKRIDWAAASASEKVQARAPDAVVDLGRALFFDPILSSNNISCSSCHLPGRAFGPAASRKLDADGPRPPSLLDVGRGEAFGWDGHFASIEAVTFAPITSPKRMNMPETKAIERVATDLRYMGMFADAYGYGAKPTKATIEAALAAYQRTIGHQAAPFDRWLAGDDDAMTPTQKRGFALFTGKANCAACHKGSALSDGSFHDIGTGGGADRGRGKLFPKSAKMQYTFKTPGLRDLTVREPYLHDGSAATLREVIDLYDKGGIDRPSRDADIRKLGLAEAEKDDLEAFLRALDSTGGGSRKTASRGNDG